MRHAKTNWKRVVVMLKKIEFYIQLIKELLQTTSQIVR